MDQDVAKKLETATREKLRKLNSLRGREVEAGEFWDVVVVTAVDVSQRESYELQIREKVHRKELPLGVNYTVLSDPPGPKIGNGGSTLYALQHLSDTFGKMLSKLRVIMIHAGGFSQRLPSASALGKIFMAFPLGDPIYQMLELKLAMYVDFPSQMKPGVLVTCADDIELYSTGEGERVQFDKPGFTALAHPSPLTVGTTHGVFVLDLHENSSCLDVENTSCLRFLHKPSIDEMLAAGAVCKRENVALPDTEFVYTDSTYYVAFDTAVSLLNLLKELGPLDCEIDAYGDFLQALGPQATIDYTDNTANVTKQESSLVCVRRKIFQRLRGTPLNVILLNTSRFYHIGTTTEYLFHLTQDEAVKTQLGLLSSAFSVCEMNKNISPRCCIMSSVIEPRCSVGAGSVVEYSTLGDGVSVGRDSIVSGCLVSPGVSVPDRVFMHSLCVNHQKQARFVTVFFGINDNLKLSVGSRRCMEELNILGFSLSECLTQWDMEKETLTFSGDTSSCSLWNARLFPISSDQQSSFLLSVKMLQAVLSGSTSPLPKDTQLLSMHDCLLLKNLEEMLKLRKRLYDEITQKRFSI